MGGKLIAELCHYTSNVSLHYLIMAAQWDRPLYFAAVVSIFFLLFRLFFLSCSQRSEIWCLQYFHTWCARNLLLSLLMKEFWKSLSSWQVSGKSKVASFNGHIEYIHSVFRKTPLLFFYIISSQVNELHKNFIIYSWKNAHYKYLRIVYLFAKYFCY